LSVCLELLVGIGADTDLKLGAQTLAQGNFYGAPTVINFVLCPENAGEGHSITVGNTETVKITGVTNSTVGEQEGY